MFNAFQWNCFNLVYTCNIALIIILKCDVTKFRAPPLCHTMSHFVDPSPLNVWRNLWMVPKNSSKLNKFLHSEVNLLIQHITVQDQGGQNYSKYFSYFTVILLNNVYVTISFQESNIVAVVNWKPEMQVWNPILTCWCLAVPALELQPRFSVLQEASRQTNTYYGN